MTPDDVDFAMGKKRAAENATEKQLLCPHLNFAAQVNVARITDDKTGNLLYFTTEIRVECAECGLPFHFKGLPCGLNPHGAAMSPDGLEARISIGPGIGGILGPQESPPDNLGPGFTVRQRV
jgi:hypothetical protein